MCSDRDVLGLNRPGQVASYRGFVFANASGDAGSLDEHLGPGGIELLDWACDLSPVGELQINAGWVGQRVSSNWKMWAESDLDGYHLGRLHASLWRVVPGSQYEAAVLAGENVVTATTRIVVGDTSSWSSGAATTASWPGSASSATRSPTTARH